LIKTDLQLLRYSIFENILKEILGFFKGRKEESRSSETESAKKSIKKAKSKQKRAS